MADMIFEEVDPLLKVEWSQKDGSPVERGLQFGSVYGSARSILVAERVVLNFMQRMSGIATLTKRTWTASFKKNMQFFMFYLLQKVMNTLAMVDAARPARILETRKTAPALRLVDKWAVLLGGGENHRMGLFDMVMLKDNHISVAGGVTNAIASVEQYLKENNLQMAVEVIFICTLIVVSAPLAVNPYINAKFSPSKISSCLCTTEHSHSLSLSLCLTHPLIIEQVHKDSTQSRQEDSIIIIKDTIGYSIPLTEIKSTEWLSHLMAI
eukprot:Gb_00045 [translate_table: standard]